MSNAEFLAAMQQMGYWGNIAEMESKSPARPLAGLQGRLESSEEHWAQHDQAQLRFWLAQPVAERLAQAERYRVRQFGEGPHVLPRTFKLLPSVVTDER